MFVGTKREHYLVIPCQGLNRLHGRGQGRALPTELFSHYVCWYKTRTPSRDSLRTDVSFWFSGRKDKTFSEKTANKSSKKAALL
jgi:hypothetical protein